MYLPENVLLYGEREEGTDKSTFLEPRFKDARFKLLQTIIILSLARFMCFKYSHWTLFPDRSDVSSHKNLT